MFAMSCLEVGHLFEACPPSFCLMFGFPKPIHSTQLLWHVMGFGGVLGTFGLPMVMFCCL